MFRLVCLLSLLYVAASFDGLYAQLLTDFKSVFHILITNANIFRESCFDFSEVGDVFQGTAGFFLLIITTLSKPAVIILRLS